MFPMTQEELTKLLKRYGLEPNKTFGQNFLLDETVLENIVSSADLSKTDTVLEVGPGIGNLTALLAEKAGQVLCVEKDLSFKPLLNALCKKYKNVQVVYADILDFDFVSALKTCRSSYDVIPTKSSSGSVRRSFSEVGGIHTLRKNFGRDDTDILRGVSKSNNQISYKVVANLPYYLTGAAFQLFLRSVPVKPSSITVLIQKEVAENVVAKPGKTNLLSLSVQLLGVPRIVQVVPARSFFPAPKVDSCVVHIDVPATPVYLNVDEVLFFKVARACFSGKRKQIHNSLQAGLGLSAELIRRILMEAKLVPEVRPQQLSLEQFILLTCVVKPYVEPYLVKQYK